MSKRSPARIHASASRGRLRWPATRMPQASRCAVRMRRLVALSSTTSTRLPRSEGCTPLRSRRRGHGHLGGGGPDREAELAAHADLARDLDAAAHQLGQPLADGQAEAGAAVAPRGRGVDLAERLEEAAEPIRPGCRCRCRAPRRSARGAGPRRPTRRALTESTTSPRSVNLTALESRFRRTWRRRVTSPDDGGRRPVGDQVGQVEALLGGPGGHEVERRPRRTRADRRAGTPARACPPRSSRSRGCR